VAAFRAADEDQQLNRKFDMATMMDLRNATLSARQRTNDNSISTRVEAGRVQIVRVTYPPEKRGRSVVTPVTAFVSPDEAVQALKSL
jgi:hypothetical protein